LIQLDSLHNHYFLLRHGQSEANVLEIIVSNPDEGVEKYGLTPTGRAQIASSVQGAKARGLLDSSTLIYSSDFKRCRESAEIAQAVLACPPPHFTAALRERFFGTWDHTSHGNYQQVWSLDEQDPTQTSWHVESVVAVLQRTIALIHDLEARYHSALILLISHGDPLQILQTAFEHVSPALHRHLPSLATAEIRQLS
jgi:probable phosphoglycerate mutase